MTQHLRSKCCNVSMLFACFSLSSSSGSSSQCLISFLYLFGSHHLASVFYWFDKKRHLVGLLALHPTSLALVHGTSLRLYYNVSEYVRGPEVMVNRGQQQKVIRYSAVAKCSPVHLLSVCRHLFGKCLAPL